MELSRRGALGAGVALGAAALGGCSSDSEPKSRSKASTSPSARSSGQTSAAASPTANGLPAVTAYQPSSGDLQPACKLAAARHVETAGNGRGRALQVVFAQYGGLLSDTASVLVVTRSWTLTGGRVHRGGHTFDVRLHRSGEDWLVDRVYPSRPGAAAATSTTARAVLASDRIELPPAAEADVRSGQVHDTALTALLTLARDYRVGISVVRSGHPLYVFGTDRSSDHPQGRAFDTWLIDGHPVVDPRTSRQLVTEYMHAAAEAGSYNVGGPYLLGAAPQYFSDDTHHDHVHAGFLG